MRVRPLLLGLALTLTPATAFAQSGQDQAMAESLFQQARDLMKDKKYDQACPMLEQSQKLDPKLGTALNIAVCHEGQGKTASAWAEFSSAATLARRQGQDQRADFADKKKAELAAKLSYLVISGGDDAAVEIELDGKPFAGAMLNAKLPVDPGRHVVVVSAPGKKPWRYEFVMPDGPTELPVMMPVLEDADEAAPPIVAPTPDRPAPSPDPAPSTPPDDGGSNTAEVVMWTGFAVGGAGLLLGAITGGLTLSKSGDIKDRCEGDACPADTEGDIDSATTLANVSNVGFVLGGVGVAVGVIGLVMSGDGEEEASASIEPVLGPGYAGLKGRF